MLLTPTLIHWLQSAEAEPWLEVLTAAPPDDAALLPTLMQLRRHFSPKQAAALVETARLRQHARTKFPETAARMFFSNIALQQASAAPIARYTARRLRSFAWVVDLGCGAGGDSIALAEASHVLAVDNDPLSLALVQANAAALGMKKRILPVQADIRYLPCRTEAVWADPGRRRSGRRLFDPEALQPPLSLLLAHHRFIANMGIKLMPGLPHSAIPPQAEAEWISLDGQLKEVVLWLGEFCRTSGRRATVLPGGNSIRSEGRLAPLAPPGSYLFEPNPAVLRAGAVGDLAIRYNLWQFDRKIAYLSGNARQDTPFTRVWQILEHHSFDLKTLNKRLRALQAQVTAVKKRGSPIEPESFRRRLYRHRGGRSVVVILTRVQNRPWMFICESVNKQIRH